MFTKNLIGFMAVLAGTALLAGCPCLRSRTEAPPPPMPMKSNMQGLGGMKGTMNKNHYSSTNNYGARMSQSSNSNAVYSNLDSQRDDHPIQM